MKKISKDAGLSEAAFRSLVWLPMGAPLPAPVWASASAGGRRHREIHHLVDSPRINPKPPRHWPLDQTLNPDP
jgi:hypothetical protein